MKNLRFLLLLLPNLLFGQIFPSPGNDFPKSFPPEGISQGVRLGHVKSLQRLAAQPEENPVVEGPEKESEEHENEFPQNTINNNFALPLGAKDPLLEPGLGGSPKPTVIQPGVQIEGLRDPNVYPPDPVCKVGRQHVVQMVNGSNGAWMKIWDKAGNEIVPAFNTTRFWDAVGASGLGDPVIQYDALAERWLFIELAGFYVNELVLAISDGPDPTEGWTAYRFQALGFPDYPKLYVWGDSYFITANEITNANLCSGYALERAALLAGSEYFQLYRFEMPTYSGVAFQPATGVDFDNGTPPPPGSPALIVRMYDDSWNGGADHLELWEMRADWSNPSNSSITGPVVLPVTPFESSICFGWLNCLQQPDEGRPRITALDQIIMFRAPYRNFGNYESIVLNHLSDASDRRGPGGQAAMRWYELRRFPGQNWQVYQEGAFAPDFTNRFMNTIAQDRHGNIATGYSVVSTQVQPGLRIAARRKGDPAGKLSTTEYVLAEGEVSHESERWGDYSSMVLDPVDQETFWFTGEYQPEGDRWGTRIASFTIRRDNRDIAPAGLSSPVTGPSLSSMEPVSVVVHNYGKEPAANATLQVWIDGNLLETASVEGPIAPGDSVRVDLQAQADLSTPGKFYSIKMITQWNADLFPENDTLVYSIQHRPQIDLSVRRYMSTESFSCDPKLPIGIVIRNEGINMVTQAQVGYSLNGGNTIWQNWSGELAPYQIDTIFTTIPNLSAGINNLSLQVSTANDARAENNTLNTQHFALLNGEPIRIVVEPWVDETIRLELRSGSGLHWQGEHESLEKVEFYACVDNINCLKLLFYTQRFYWQGKISLYDYNNTLLGTYEGYVSQKDSIDFCLPQRFQRDLAAVGRLLPKDELGLSAAEPVAMLVRNTGLVNTSTMALSWRQTGGSWNTETANVSLKPNEEYQHTFQSTLNASMPFKTYPLEFRVALANDENLANDIWRDTIRNWPTLDLAIIQVVDSAVCDRISGSLLRYTFVNKGLERISAVRMGYDVDGEYFERFGGFYPSLAPQDTIELWQVAPPFKQGINTVTYSVAGLNQIFPDLNPSNDSGYLSLSIDTLRAGIDLYLHLDNDPEETSWELQEDGGPIIASGGGYTKNFDYLHFNFCLDRDRCYVFRLFDSAADGFSGYVNVYYRNEQLLDYNGGQFGGSTELGFCTLSPGSCPDILLIASTQSATTAQSSDGAIGLLPIGGEAPYIFILNGVTIQVDSVFSKLLPGVYTVTCRDVNGCETSIPVTVNIATQTAEPVLTRRLEVSPNPAKDLVRLSAEALKQDVEASGALYDTQGKAVRPVRLMRWDGRLQGLVEVKNLPSGVYYLKLKTGTGFLTGRLVKE